MYQLYLNYIHTHTHIYIETTDRKIIYMYNWPTNPIYIQLDSVNVLIILHTHSRLHQAQRCLLGHSAKGIKEKA